MNKRALIFCFIFASIIIALLIIDNQEYSAEVYDYDEQEFELVYVDWIPQSISDQMGLNVQSVILLAIFGFPFLLVFESSFFPKMRTGWWRLLFFIQAIILAWATFGVWFLMVFKLWADIHFFITYYLILFYLGLGVLWNLLLGIPFVEIKFIQKGFEVLSLKQKKINV